MIRTKEDAGTMIGDLVRLAGPADLIGEILANARDNGLAKAITRHDSGLIFDQLMRSFSYQGISDRISDAYIDAHGNPALDQLLKAIDATAAPCPLLTSFDTYKGCGYRKSARTCSRPTHLPACPVRELELRKGALNQLAVSLALFIRDRCDGDLVGYMARIIDGCVGQADGPEAARRQLVQELTGIEAVSSKLANMVLSDLLIAGSKSHPAWPIVGGRMIAIDSLVHNFLHRTGILKAFNRPHPYGLRCYGDDGCQSTVRDLSAGFDARTINPAYPADFPRLVQLAIWRFCAEGGLDICNGRQINDRFRCSRKDCPVGDRCSRQPLSPDPVVLVELRG